MFATLSSLASLNRFTSFTNDFGLWSLPVEKIEELAYSDRYKEYYAELLMELLAIDTTPKSDISIIRESEIKAFGIIERELKDID
jgi:hypothetical protein